MAGISNRNRVEYGNGSYMVLSDITYFCRIRNRQDFQLLQTVFVTDNIFLLGSCYKKNAIIIKSLCAESGDPVFAKIRFILRMNNSWFFLLQNCITNGFESRFFAYSIIFSDSFEIFELVERDLMHPLDYYYIEHMNLVSLRHAVIR